MVEITTYSSNKLSTFRTKHQFSHYAEIKSVEDYEECRAYAKEQDLPLFILGNGSNVLFTRNTVKSLVVRIKIPEDIQPIENDLFVIGAASQVMKVLKYCERQQRDSFYFLASVPASIGGALAMNAGAGAGATIFDFVEDLTYLEDGKEITVQKEDLTLAHRQTIFTGIQDKLILRATFRFPVVEGLKDRIKERAHWARDHQDLAHPNCGTVFRKYHGPIIRKMRRIPPGGIRYPFLKAQYSRRVNNWIICNSKSSRPVVFLIRTVQFIHLLFGKKAETEIVQVR